MDKQDFQEQDFMEILVRLPCTCKQKLFYPRAETFLPASRKYYLYSKEDRSY